tara:strand:+ start:4076 stop:5980 length:1905 start_codon:yes stop_codon:yes gene_type:complete
LGKNRNQRKKNKPLSKKRSPKIVVRTLFVGAALFLFFGSLAVRLTQLTLFSGERVEKFSEQQRFRSVKLHAPRGYLFDRNHNELAVSIPLMSAYINPKKVTDARSAARNIAFSIEPKNNKKRNILFRKLLAKLKSSSNKKFVWISRKLEPKTYAGLKKKNIKGIGFVSEYKRFYPKRDVAAKIIGFCGIDNQGLSGLEYHYDDLIEPVQARAKVRRDAFGRVVSMPKTLDVSEGAKPINMILTIDERVQYIAERALERKVIETNAKGGIAIVMNPHTGGILAMAEQPKFNPNNFSHYNPERWKAHAVSHAMEPGSTFKVFVAAAALEERLTSSRDKIYCENGKYKIGQRIISEAHNSQYKNLTLLEVIAKSSNIGAVKLAERLGKEKLFSYLTSFGFGLKTGIDLPYENSGLLRPVSSWSLGSLPSISFGQEVSVTPIQLATGISVFANGGYLVRPHLVLAYKRDNKLEKIIKPYIRHRVISEATAKTVVKIMEGVVTSGTGGKAALSGFEVAGKTGTAQKIDKLTKSYSSDKFLSSFVGFFPANNPRLVILVMVDEPEGIAWGGSVAAPVFSEIASRSARALRIVGRNTDRYVIDWSRMTNTNNDEVVSNKSNASGTKDLNFSGLLSIIKPLM